MKKLFALVFAALLCVGMTACGSGASSIESTPASSTPVYSDFSSEAISSAASSVSSSTPSSTPASTAASNESKTSTATTGTVTAAGSSALLPLAQAAADEFVANNPKASVTVNGGGSGTGLTQVAAGSIDIGNSDVYAEEKLDAKSAATLVDHRVCTITMAAIVNKALGVTNLTTDQLVKIFTGVTKNWKEVGGPDLAILLVTRPTSSGTRALFKKWALNGAEEASNAALETDDSGTLLQTVLNNPGSIGYVALSYLVNNDKITPVSINGVAPTLANTNNGTYLVWGYEHMYTKGEGSAAAKAFIKYITSDEFAKNIEAKGYGVSAKLSNKAISSHTTDTNVTGTVTAAGSSALLPLVQAAADAFIVKNPKASVTVNGGGSGTGLTQVAAGSIDIGNSDVFASEKLAADAASGLVDHKVCTVTMAAVVNKTLGISNLTKDQLISIFTGDIKNWKGVGGPDLAIMLVTRPTSSGTRALFKKWAMDGWEEATQSALETDDSGTLLKTVEDNKGAIGYIALSYLVNNSKVIGLAINGVAPTLANTYNGTYPVWGYEHMYTKGEGSAAAQAFINYMMSDMFSVNIEKMGYGITAKMSAKAIDSHK